MSSSDQGNYGIIGNVTAKAVAVGSGARSVVHESGTTLTRGDLDAAFAALLAAVEQLGLGKDRADILRAHIGEVSKQAEEEHQTKPANASLLAGLVDKLKLAGVALETAVGFAKPLKTIAQWFGVPIPF